MHVLPMSVCNDIHICTKPDKQFIVSCEIKGGTEEMATMTLVQNYKGY